MDKKISQLGATTVPVNADLFAIVQSGVTKKITYQNLVAAIVAETSLDLNQVLTNGNTTGGKNIVVTNGDTFISTDGKSQLSFQNGDGFLFDYSDVATGGLLVDSAKTQLYHSDVIDLNSTIVKIRKNLITSGTTDKTWIEFFTGDSCRITTDGGARNEAWLELSPTTSGLFFDGYGVEIDASKSDISHPTQINLSSPLYTFQQLTASTVPYLDASKNLVSSSITPTELGYLTGATSSIQSQIDALVSGLSWKQAVRVATTAAGTLASDFENGDTIDGVILITGDRILIKDQAAATENGIYIVNASGAPTRSSDMNVAAEFPSATVAVSDGTVNADTQWVCTNNSVIIGITSITFVAVGGTSYIGTTNRITVTGNQIDISATFEALLGKVANPLSQFASTTSAQLAGVISDETGTGSLVFSASPTFTGTPLSTTAAYGTDTTQIATTEFVHDELRDTFFFQCLAVNPSDNQNLYMNGNAVAPSATDTTRSFTFGEVRTIRKAYIALQQSANGDSAQVDVYLRNITTNTNSLLGSFTSDWGALSGKGFLLSSSLSIVTSATDDYTIYIDCPTWSISNPTAWLINGKLEHTT